MAKLVTLLPLLFPLGFLLLVADRTTCLTLKLVHLDSPESPFYLVNATYTLRTQRLLQQSKARLYRLSRNAQEEGAFPQTVRSTVSFQPNFLFMAEVHIGTFPNRQPHYISYFLILDTGSDLTWVQCEHCQDIGHECFHQIQPIFPNSRSTSYKPLCKKRQRNKCNWRNQMFSTYDKDYLDGSSSRGTLALESFTFDSSTGDKEVLRLSFGCGLDQRNFYFVENNKVAGILGLGVNDGYVSFADQLKTHSNGRFSYCVPPSNEEGHVPPSFLRFGIDIPHRTNLKTIRIFTHPSIRAYFVNLKDLSLGGRRLKIHERHFARGSSNSKRCAIDSGTGFSFLSNHPFQKLANAMIDHFPKGSGFEHIGELFSYNLCFEKPRSSGFESLPNITFHFDEADLEVMPEHLYDLGDTESFSYFCLGILKAEHGINIIGAMQQINQRIVFDTENMQLDFGPEDCKHNY